MGLTEFVKGLDGSSAAIFLAGISFGWGLCVKIRVTPLRTHADKLETKLDDLLAKIEAQFWSAR